MLEQVKSCIESAPKESFEEYFENYIMAVQDELIGAEFQYFEQHNSLDSVTMSKLIAESYK